MNESTTKVMSEIKLEGSDDWYPRYADKYRKIALQCVDPAKNHLKFYIMSTPSEMVYSSANITNSNNKWTAQYGRIGNKPQTHEYTHRKTWDEVINSKIYKGYKVVHAVKWGEIENDELAKFFADMGEETWELE
jgi:predicted DNA-binding WGR domain protein